MKRYGSIVISLATAAMLSLVATAAFASSKYTQVTEALSGFNGVGTSTGPVDYWKFEEPNGTTLAQPAYGVGAPVLSYSTSAYHFPEGYPQSKVSAAGIDGSGVLFNGANDFFLSNTGVYLDGGNLGNFKPHSFTFEYWVKPVNNTLGNSSGSFMFTGANSLSYWQGYGLQNGYFGFSAGSGAAPTTLIQYKNDVPNGQWSMLTATFTETDPGSSGPNTAAGDWRFYVNGQLQHLGVNPSFTDIGTFYHQTGLPNWSDRGDWAGVYQFFQSNSAAGDELAIFDFALSQNQILDQFNAVPEPGMLSLLALGGAFLVWRRKVAAKRA